MIQHRAPRNRPAEHWRRYRARMSWMTALAAALALAALGWLRFAGGPMPWQARAAVGVGVFMAVLVTAGLMGLVFASARGGHDAAVIDHDAEKRR